MKSKPVAAWLVAIVLTLVATTASAAEPMDVIKEPIDALIAVLNDPQYATAEAKKVQRDVIWQTVKPMFDFEEVSRRAVARNWKRFSADEKTGFIDVFSQFLANTYIDKIQGEYHNEQIEYLSQSLHKEVYAEVRTHIVREAVKMKVNYRMRKNEQGTWRVYDIIVEGVSLVKNYRTQFASILRKKEPAQLIEQLNKKLTEQKRRLAEKSEKS